MEYISVETRTLTIKELLNRLKGNNFGKIISNEKTKFDVQTSRIFIENILLNLPINTFVFSSDKNNIWTLEDGQKRFNAIFDFANEQLDLVNLKILKDIENFSMLKDLNGSYYNNFFDTNITCLIINPNTPELIKIEVISRFKNN